MAGTDDTLSQYLDRREAELQRRVDDLHKLLVPMEAELADVRKAKAAIAERNEPASLRLGGNLHLRRPSALYSKMFDALDQQADVVKTLVTPQALAMPRAPEGTPPSPYAQLTQKQLVVKALKEHFHKGATANELIQFFHDAWGRRDVIRSSLSPQLSRLKLEGQIDLEGKVWTLLKGQKSEAPADKSESASKNSSPEESPKWR